MKNIIIIIAIALTGIFNKCLLLLYYTISLIFVCQRGEFILWQLFLTSISQFFPATINKSIRLHLFE